MLVSASVFREILMILDLQRKHSRSSSDQCHNKNFLRVAQIIPKCTFFNIVEILCPYGYPNNALIETIQT